MNTNIVRVGIGAFGAAEAASAGWKITRQPYADGQAGIRQSLEEVCRLMREGRIDPEIKEWAVQALISKGLDGRNRPTIRQQSQALLDVFRAQTIYVPDAVGAEHVQAAHVTLCLRDRCIPGEDCESLVIALGSAMLSIGLQVSGVKVSYGASHQEHILLGLEDNAGNAIYVDPSTKQPVMDRVPGAVEEIWVDPMEQLGPVGTGAEIVTLGAPQERELYLQRGVWFEYSGGRWWVWSAAQNRWAAGPAEKHAYGMPKTLGQPFVRNGSWWTTNGETEVELSAQQAQGLGLTPVGTTAAASATASAPIPYQTVTNNQVYTGLRYRMDISITTNANPTGLEQSEQDFLSENWFVESLDPIMPSDYDSSTQTFVQTYVLQGIAKSNMTLANTAMNTSQPGIQYLSVSVQASSASVDPGATPVTLATSPTAAAAMSSNVSALVIGGAAAVVGGVGWGAWKLSQRKGRR